MAGIVGVVAVATGGSLAAQQQEPNCVPEGNALTISANNVQFSKDCLMAPADEAFTITFNNEEVQPHNVSIYDEADGNKNLFRGEVFLGPRTVTYSVPPLREGRYLFVCDPHEDKMRGLFVVGDPPPAPATTAPPSTTTTSAGLLPFGQS